MQHFVPEPMLLGSGLTNYWGTTAGLLRPTCRIRSPRPAGPAGGRVPQDMVDTLHAAGLK